MSTEMVKHEDKLPVLPDFAGDAIDAPPPAERRVVYWRNGNAQLKKLGGVQYTGGWCINAENLNPDILDASKWELENMTSRDGKKEFAVFTTPVIHAAMLGWREAWTERQHVDGVRPVYRRDYGEGLTSYVEVACIADSVKTGVVLTAKGHNAAKLKKAYGIALAELAARFKSPVPPWAFFMPLGGETDEKGVPIYTAYGKGEQQSSIVHIVPKWKLTPEFLKAAQVREPLLAEARKFMGTLPDWKLERFQARPIAADVVDEDPAFT